MRSAPVFAIAIVLMIFFSPVAAAQIEIPDDIPLQELIEASNSDHALTLDGPGLSLLDFGSTPDEHGLLWAINEPSRKFDNWTVAVKNDSGEAITNLAVTLEIEVDGKWYLGDIEGSNALVRPTVIPDGGIGIVQLGNVGGSPQNWTDHRIVVESINSPLTFTIIPLEFEYEEEDGLYTIDVMAHDSQVVSNVWVFAGCVVDGTISEIKVSTSDLLQFRPGESESFEFRYGDCEDQNGLPVFTVSGDAPD